MTNVRAGEPVLLARLVIAFAAMLIAAGVLRHGIAFETIQRIWRNVVERPSGPVSFRFILQPSMAAIAAIHDGLRDARAGRAPYFMTVLRSRQERVGRLREGLDATSRIILLGLVMDVIYQVLTFKTFYPTEALIIALLLAFVPYVIIRGLVLRVWRSRASMRQVR
jgi:hypothetical protein